MSKRLVMIGAGGHAKVCYDIAKLMKCWDEIILLDDNPTNDYFEISGSISDTKKYIKDYEFFVAIGDNKTRRKLTKKLLHSKARITSLIHPQAIISSDVEIGIGTVVMPGAVVNTATRIGKGCIINTSSSVDHDNCIADFVHISPGVRLAGTVSIGENSHVGIGSVVINNINIFRNTTIAAGATVIKSITKSGTYVGTPAKRMEKNKC